MPNRLDLPDDLNRLVEKRETDDRRASERRAEANDPPAVDRRSGDDRRAEERRDPEA